MKTKTKKVIGAAVTLILTAALAVFLTPSASGQVTDSKPLSFCVINGTWNFTESRVHSPVRVDDIKDTGLLLDITGPRAAADPTSPGSGGKVAGYIQLATPVLLKDVVNAVLNYTPSVGTAVPGFQLVVDRTPLDVGDGYDGILVGEPGVYGANWWASKPARWAGGPAVAGGGSAVNGTLAQYAAFDTDAVVTAVGFSLGTLGVGTEARGILASLTFNATTWSFAQCPKPPVTTTTTTTTSTTTTVPTSTTTASSSSSSSTTTTTSGSSSSSSTATTTGATVPVLYENCTAVRDALNRALFTEEPGYRPELDADSDGVACELDIVQVSDSSDDLASTGANVGTVTLLGLLVLIAGGAAFLIARKRRA